MMTLNAVTSGVNCIRYGLRWIYRQSIQYVETNAKTYEHPASFVDDDEQLSDPSTLNKSRLREQHRNLLHNKKPYEQAQSWIHLTEKYQRKMYGRFGAVSGVDPKICFSTKQNIIDNATYERVAYPHTLQEMIAEVRKENGNKRAKIEKREMEIAEKVEKLSIWKKELYEKISKKEADAIATKERKERLVEEVRRHFGFKVDPRDDRFKEMLELKEREDKKKQKEAKRKAKEEKLMEKLMHKTAEQ